MTQKTKTKSNRSLTNLLLDISVFGAFLVALDPDSTGLALHEWLSIALAGGLVTHIVLHWKWIVGVTIRFFGKTATQARINYVVNTAFFINVLVIMVTGILISEYATPGLAVGSRMIRGLHEASAEAALPLLGLHIALHWKWILNTLKKYFFQPLFGGGAQKVRATMINQPIHNKEVLS